MNKLFYKIIRDKKEKKKTKRCWGNRLSYIFTISIISMLFLAYYYILKHLLPFVLYLIFYLKCAYNLNISLIY